MTNNIGSLLKETLRRLQISLLTQSRIDEIAIPIDGSVEVAPLPFELDRDTAQCASHEAPVSASLPPNPSCKLSLQQALHGPLSFLGMIKQSYVSRPLTPS
jgi:hypothetical protein